MENVMNSREKILDKIRKNNKAQDISLPSYENFGLKYEDKFIKFSEVLKSVGGEALRIRKENLDETIKGLYPNENQIATNVQGCNLGNINADACDTPHLLKNVDLAVVKGEFAVAENAAVWVKNSQNRHRALYFIAQNIVIVVDEKEILNNMHEAYEKIEFEEKAYGVFISGPSKTADIEQSLVIGAHGPKSGYVIFIK